MVRAILEGRKTQTRRVVSPDISKVKRQLLAMPYKVGDLLWVRETWAMSGYKRVEYKAFPADGSDFRCVSGWRPSIHMPRWASRLTLRITDVRVQRLQEISEEDAIAEGVEPNGEHASLCGDRCFRNEFAVLWNTINGKRYPWDSNPYVWAISFERQEVRR